MKIAFPHPPGSGGPGSFQIRFEKELKERGWEICYAGDHTGADIVFVVGGTRRLVWLWKMKLKGVPILYRLDGINWLHKKKKIGFKNYLLAELRNWSSKCIHAFLADKIIYQSKFVEEWWGKSGWKKRNAVSVIYNGVKIPPLNVHLRATSGKKRLVIMEGTIDYSPYAVQLINELADSLPFYITIELYGNFALLENKLKINDRIEQFGFLDRSKVFDVLNGSVYLSLDINPACPNTVVEALACGSPVIAFGTGALPELVKNGAGVVIPYGSDPWKLCYPDTSKLPDKIIEVFKNYTSMSKRAHDLAIKCYDIEMMIDKYEYELNELNLNKQD